MTGMRVANVLGGRARLKWIAGCSLAALLAGPAMAEQPSPPEADAAMQDIVVTAQFRAQNLQDTPLAITAINAALLEARGQSSVIDVASQSPNVTLRPATSNLGPSLQAFIRGVGQFDSSFAQEPGVGVYVDDVYYPTLTGSIIDLVDLDRVEVLRGPQGTLSGQNSIGGSIKIYSRKPDGTEGGFLQATYGRFNRVELRGAGEFALVPDKLFVRVAGTGVAKDGYVTRYDYACTHPGTSIPSFQTGQRGCKLGTEGGKSYQAVRGTLRWTPDDRFEVNVIGDYTHDTTEGAPSTLLYVGSQAGVPGVPAGNPAYQMAGVALGNATGSPFISYSPFGNYAQDTFSNSPYINYSTFTDPAPRDGAAPYSIEDRYAVSGWGVSAHIDYKLSDAVSLKSITAYRKYRSRYSFDEGTPINTAMVDNDVSAHNFSQELRLNARVMDAVDLTLGGFYFKLNGRSRQRVDIPSLQFIEDDRVRTETKAAFVNADWGVTDALHLIGGVRYTDASKTFYYGRLGIPGNIYGGAPDPRVAPLDGQQATAADDHWDFRAVAQYRWSPTLMTYAQFSTGFKIGGVNPRAFFPAQALPFGPEKLNAYEVGLKSDLFDRALRLNVSAFLNKYNGIIVIVNSCPLPGAPPQPCALPVNAGRAEVKGVELEGTLRPLPGLTLDGSLAYLDFDYKSLSASAISSGVTLSMRGPYAPKWQYSAGVQYDADLGDGGVVTPRLDLSHSAGFYTQSVNDPLGFTPARTLLNGRITWRPKDSRFSITAEVTNITNKLYYNAVFDNRGSNNTVTGFPGAPREWALTVKRTF